MLPHKTCFLPFWVWYWELQELLELQVLFTYTICMRRHSLSSHYYFFFNNIKSKSGRTSSGHICTPTSCSRSIITFWSKHFVQEWVGILFRAMTIRQIIDVAASFCGDKWQQSVVVTWFTFPVLKTVKELDKVWRLCYVETFLCISGVFGATFKPGCCCRGRNRQKDQQCQDGCGVHSHNLL